MSAFNLKLLSNVLHRRGASDAVILKTLHHCSYPEIEDTHEAVQNRIVLNKHVANCAEDGIVAVVESGIDCDCIRYEGHVHLVSSKLSEFWNYIDKMYYNAEGAIQWYVVKPSQARNIDATSRDLIMEAFEDGRGNQHVIYA